MKEIKGTFNYRGQDYDIVFNLNVMQAIQEEYGTLEKWGELTDGAEEPNAKAVIFGFTEMINEGIDIANDENGTEIPFLSKKKVARMITEIGIEKATEKLNKTIVASTESSEKNV